MSAETDKHPIDGFDGYRIDRDGMAWSCWTRNGHQPRIIGHEWHRLRAAPDGDGYLGVNLYRGGRNHRRKIHLLVLHAFVGPRPDGMQGCHNNGIVSDCALGNLRWDTPGANQRDRRAHGTDPRGERSGVAKLTAESARSIRASLAAGDLQRHIAARFGVAPSTVSGIKSRRLWAWMEAT